MTNIFKITDKTKRKIRLTEKQWKHIQKHPHMQDSIENIQLVLKNPTTIRYNEKDESVRYFYKEFKVMPPEERDFLEITDGDISNCYFNNLGDGIFQIVDKSTKEVKGVAIHSFKKRTKDLDEIKLSLPFKLKNINSK